MTTPELKCCPWCGSELDKRSAWNLNHAREDHIPDTTKKVKPHKNYVSDMVKSPIVYAQREVTDEEREKIVKDIEASVSDDRIFHYKHQQKLEDSSRWEERKSKYIEILDVVSRAEEEWMSSIYDNGFAYGALVKEAEIESAVKAERERILAWIRDNTIKDAWPEGCHACDIVDAEDLTCFIRGEK